MSLLEKAQHCITMSQELLYAGNNAGSLECALEAAKYLQLIRLFQLGSGKVTPRLELSAMRSSPEIAIDEGSDPTQFEIELAKQRVPSAEAESFPLRMIL
jgi:hypothetical protein